MFVATFAIMKGGHRSLLVPNFPLVILRGLLLACASMLFYLAAAAMNFPEAVAMYFTMPLLVTITAGIILREHVPLYRWSAVALGLIGVLAIVRPGTALFEPITLVAFAAALCYALGNVLTRSLSTSVQIAPLAFWQSSMYVAVALLLSALFGSGRLHFTGHVSLDYLTRGWIWPTAFDFLLIVALGFTTAILMLLFVTAYKLAESSFVAPFEYSAMFWAVLFSFLIWHEWPTPHALAGIALIVASGLFLAIRDR